MSMVFKILDETTTPRVSYNGAEVTSHVLVISGRSIILVCNSTGNPTPTYTWTYPEGDSYVGPTLTMDSVQTADAGGVTCTAMNTLSPTGGTAVDKTRKTTITLQVLHPPIRPSCTIIGTSISTTVILVEGTDRTITCISSANPPLITYTWSTPGHRQVSGASLKLPNVQHTADQGLYTLTVFYHGSVINSHVRVISGNSMTLTCSSTGNPSPTYTWTRPGGGSQNGSNLTFTSLDITYAGDVTCTARNKLSPTGETTVDMARQTTASLQVFKPLCAINATTILTIAILLEGSDGTISCSSSAIPTEITYTWSTPGRGLVSGANLSLTNVQHSADLGMYILTVTNIMDPTKGKTETGTNTTAFSGSVLNYKCPFISGNPSQTSLVWTSSVNNRQWNSQIVSISSVRKSDDGIYTCTAKNTMTPTGFPPQTGSHSGNMHLNVQYESLVSDFHVTEHIGTSYVTKSEYSNVTFTCKSVTVCLEKMFQQYNLFKLIKSLRKNGSYNSGLSSNLTILDIDKDDYGMYRISIDNGIGKVLVEEMYLQPAGPPDWPRGFKVIPNTIRSTSVVLTWIPGFNNGLLQTFHISYRPSIPFADWLEMNVTHTGETEMNVTLDSLEPGESYIVNLYASNLAGESARRNITLRTLTHILSVSSSRQTANGTENPGYNAAVTYEEVSMTNDKTVYDALNIRSDGSNTPHVYMSVDTSKSNAYYENVKKEDPVYNNTSLKNPVQTVL
ncbi:HMCN1-like protein [Mya arenaria]|uniref:HMCN1-like protein n=1 Tax=Mya arenaria TaxID=6604 RepID=A0ABY7E7I5_MYAAR|nr:HMCN1-like protein [Mya arenaria]